VTPVGRGGLPRLPVLLPIILALSTLLRIGSALLQGSTVGFLPGVFDEISYDTLGRRVLGGYGFTFATGWWPATRGGEPTAHWSFLYTLYLAGVYAIFDGQLLAARLIQAIVAGALQPWLTYRIASRLFGTRVGLSAAAVAALYPYFVYYAGALVTETFTIVALVWMFDLATGRVRMQAASGKARGRVTAWALLGLALGCAALLRQVTLVALPLTLAWLVWVAGRGDARLLSSRRRAAIGGAIVALSVTFALILPWTVRNNQVFGRFVLLNTNAGYVFFWANHPIHGTQFQPLLQNESYGRLIPRELASYDEAALDAALMARGIGFVRDDPARFFWLSLSRIEEYFKFWPSSESSRLSNVARVLSFGLALPFILYGIWLAVARWRRVGISRQGPAVLLLLLFVAAYVLVHLLSWALIRYRLPVDGILVIFAGLGLATLLTRLVGRSMRGEEVPSRPSGDPAQAETVLSRRS
jgi:4-amino-4-deoxy-L-arabinose transferase-like glycosyltransferase